jgi:hypothetical protein
MKGAAASRFNGVTPLAEATLSAEERALLEGFVEEVRLRLRERGVSARTHKGPGTRPSFLTVS